MVVSAELMGGGHVQLRVYKQADMRQQLGKHIAMRNGCSNGGQNAKGITSSGPERSIKLRAEI